MLMLCLSAVFSVFSTIMMTYLSMTTELGSWIAPMFVVVCMVLIMPFFDGRWFKGDAVVTIAASSIAGMVGICLGLSFPSFYFLEQSMFTAWQMSWWQFVGIVASFVLCAGFCALIVSYFMKDIILARPKARFPMAQLVSKVLSAENQAVSGAMIILGLVCAGMWNTAMYVAGAVASIFVAQANMIPMLVSVGFVTGITIAPAALMGLVTRVCVIDFLQQYFSADGSVHMFLVTFASGMMIAWFLQFMKSMVVLSKIKAMGSISFWKRDLPRATKLYVAELVLFGCAILLLSLWGVPMLAQWYVVVILLLLAWYVALIIAEVGVIEVSNYVLFVLLPLIYASTLSSSAAIAVVVFSTLFLGLVVNALFSYKLAQLAKVPFSVLCRYQIMACVLSAFTAGFFLLWYSKTFNMGSMDLFFAKARALDDIIKYGQYNYHVVAVGFVYGLLVRMFTSEILVVIGALIMNPAISGLLVLSGALAHLVKDREKYYPLWFGVYAGHSLCLMLKAFF